MKKQKKKPKRKYNPRKHARPQTRAAPNPLLQSVEVMNRLKPVMDAVQKAAERQRERGNTKTGKDD